MSVFTELEKEIVAVFLKRGLLVRRLEFEGLALDTGPKRAEIRMTWEVPL